jgi:hypothetical protein
MPKGHQPLLVEGNLSGLGVYCEDPSGAASYAFFVISGLHDMLYSNL